MWGDYMRGQGRGLSLRTVLVRSRQAKVEPCVSRRTALARDRSPFNGSLLASSLLPVRVRRAALPLVAMPPGGESCGTCLEPQLIVVAKL
jgi:hypothetical protein